ncbi:Nn.00g083700.m01.CDS01 [Neocucurbitaria sp. VM-36]
MKIFNFFIGLVFGLAILVGAAPTPEDDLSNGNFVPFNLSIPTNMTTDPALAGAAGYDPSFDYFDYSTVQVWVGRPQNTVGHVIGRELYGTVYQQLDHFCPDNSQTRWGGVKWGHCDDPKGLGFLTRCLTNPPFGSGDCYTQIWGVWGEWENDKIRRLLIGAVAGTLEALTTDQPIVGPSNCFSLANKKACNVGDVVRVNLPPTGNNQKNYLHIRIYNSVSWYSDFHCCESRPLVDRAIDKLGKEMVETFPQWWNKEFKRDSRCIIDGWTSC